MTTDPEALPAAEFVTTFWPDVQVLHEEGPNAEAARERFGRAYWQPLYIFLRVYLRKFRADAGTAEDLLQSFFLNLFEKKKLRYASPDRGKLRDLLCSSLVNFSKDQWKRAGREKNRPSGGWVSIETAAAEEWFAKEFAQFESPDKAYERAWALRLLSFVLGRLRNEYTATGKANLFSQIEPLLQGADEATPYSELARNVPMPVGAFTVAVHRCRLQYGDRLRCEVAHTLGWPGKSHRELKLDLAKDKEFKQRLDEELAYLLAAVS